MKQLCTLALLILTNAIFAQLTPEITSWIINTTNNTGYAGILTNVQQVQYSTNNVYVSATCIPDYTIGPWTSSSAVAFGLDVPIPTWAWLARDADSTKLSAKRMFVGFMIRNVGGLFAFYLPFTLGRAIRPFGPVLLVGDGATSSQ